MAPRSSADGRNAIFTVRSGRGSMPLAAATVKIFLQFRPQSPIIYIGNYSIWHTMTQPYLARNIPGVWSDSIAGRTPLLLGIMLGCAVALSAESAPARLAHGIDNFENRKYNEAIQELKTVQPLLPNLADYVAYYLASSREELKDFTQAQKDLALFSNISTPSPLAPKAVLLEAKALAETGSPGGAIALLRSRYEELPQPPGDFTLAQVFETAHEPAQAAT